ncbi:MAG: MATE family efflux transporter [Clostridium sp.]
MEETCVMEKKALRKKIYSMIIPITVESMLQMTAGFVSAAFIGRLDAMAISALGISTRITQIIWSLFKGITTGGTVLVAQAYGANNEKKVRDTIMQTLISCVLLVIILAGFMQINGKVFLKVFNPSVDLISQAESYLKIVAFGLPFVVIMLVVAGSLQGMGNGKTPMKIAAAMNGANILISPVLIFGKFGLPAMGIQGAALGLVIAQFIGASLGIYTLFNKNGILYKCRNKNSFKLDKSIITKVYKVGFPSSLESMFWQFASIILTTLILAFGEIAMASYQLGLQAESISYMPAVGFSVAATAFTGQALGARNKDLGKAYLKEILKGSTIITIISSALLLFVPNLIMMLLTDNVDIINLGSKYLILMGLVQIPQNISACINGSLRGAGFTKVPMYCAGIGIWVIRIPLALIFTKVLHLGVIAIWVAMCVDLVVRLMVSVIFYKKYKIFSENSKVEVC